MADRVVITKRTRSKDYREIFVYGVFGGDRPDYFEAIIQSYGVDAAETQSNVAESQTLDPKQIVVEIKDEVSLKMTPRVARIIYEWLGSHIKRYEELYGAIELEKQPLQSKKKKS